MLRRVLATLRLITEAHLQGVFNFKKNMAKIIRFSDDLNDSQYFEAFRNAEGRICIRVGDLEGEDPFFEGWVTFDKQDLLQLINELHELSKNID